MIWLNNKTNKIQMVNVNFGFRQVKKIKLCKKFFYFYLLQKNEHKLEDQACYFAKVPLICL